MDSSLIGDVLKLTVTRAVMYEDCPVKVTWGKMDEEEVSIVAACVCLARPAWQAPLSCWQHGCLPPPFRAGRQAGRNH
jgi:hypothetical protein